jgi:hypothetical protein
MRNAKTVIVTSSIAISTIMSTMGLKNSKPTVPEESPDWTERVRGGERAREGTWVVGEVGGSVVSRDSCNTKGNGPVVGPT